MAKQQDGPSYRSHNNSEFFINIESYIFFSKTFMPSVLKYVFLTGSVMEENSHSIHTSSITLMKHNPPQELTKSWQ